MPPQPRQLNPFSYLPRRLQIVTGLTLFLIFCVLFLGSSTSDPLDPYVKSIPGGQRLHDSAENFLDHAEEAIHNYNPFGTPAHKPAPEQANSSVGETRWLSDWTWRNPFSSSTTFDEERAVLPPLQQRQAIYTYWNETGRRSDEKSRNAEKELLTIWRRAWWAQGFKPVVLGPGEAMNNPLYRTMQGLPLENAMNAELMRWLAWGNMGTGIFSNWLTLPMAAHDDATLAFLRRGEFPKLTRFKGLGDGLFVGSKDDVDRAIKQAISNPKVGNFTSMIEALHTETLVEDDKVSGLAFYSRATITKNYKLIGDKFGNKSTIADGMAMLPILINSHLHLTWQSSFPDGIAVLKPLPHHTSNLIEPAIDLARNLSQCPDTPIPTSCPPNNSKCKPCNPSYHMRLSTPPVFRNKTSAFQIATVPHPYTMSSLEKQRDHFNAKSIRRETKRDVWTLAATQEILGSGISSFSRLTPLKDAIASEAGISSSLWVSAERPFDGSSEKDLDELDWIFGFKLPRAPERTGQSETPVPGPERRPKKPSPEYGDAKPLTDVELEQEKALLMKARMAVDNGRRGSRGVKHAQKVREMVEAWSLADTEIWKFIRALNARRRIERIKWEEEEEEYLGKGTFGRWIDKISRDV
ncbi:hypothetical protein K431DRAFT_289594 [Polychaeton citri CBS 116435]|uniref:Uncharacterized protein n=1 Tax=Polychaeton citri CBS 116435 TaxID=1314669 RepID=A0A9P4PWI6_9PEZI|nr:hypothetical protein K431DRAFT_289594 [Polychaeton citri CBS 116435]